MTLLEQEVSVSNHNSWSEAFGTVSRRMIQKLHSPSALLKIPTGVWYPQFSRKSTNSRDMNYSKKIVSNEDYDDKFEPLTVFHSSSVIEASCFIKATI